jgi:hypothetical protein
MLKKGGLALLGIGASVAGIIKVVAKRRARRRAWREADLEKVEEYTLTG